MANHLLVLDEGTTSTRAVLFDDQSGAVDEESRKLRVATPTSTTVEQDATEIADKSAEVLRAVIGRAQAQSLPITALGITNQRTTTVLWDRSTGEPVRTAISWQDTRTQRWAGELKQKWGERGAGSGAPTIRADLARVPVRAGPRGPCDRFRPRRHRVPASPLHFGGGRA